eukprot:jgi/Chlat1/329/Chrsp1S03076
MSVVVGEEQKDRETHVVGVVRREEEDGAHDLAAVALTHTATEAPSDPTTTKAQVLVPLGVVVDAGGEDSVRVVRGEGQVRFSEDTPTQWLQQNTTLVRCTLTASVPSYCNTTATPQHPPQQQQASLLSSARNVAREVFESADAAFAVELMMKQQRKGNSSTNSSGEATTVGIVTLVRPYREGEEKVAADASVVEKTMFARLKRQQVPGHPQLPKVATATLLVRRTHSTRQVNGLKPAAPLLSFQPCADKETTFTHMAMHLDVLVYAHNTLTLPHALKQIQSTLVAQAISLAQATSVGSSPSSGSSISTPKAYHFQPPDLEHAISLIYSQDDEKNSQLRYRIHQRLGLPLDRPLVRPASAISFGDTDIASTAAPSTSISKRLRDVHNSLGNSFVSNGTKYLISGSYDYYHYMQDRFDDNGWGCAYRSLQTIISWFRLQHYTNVPEVLVRIEDKPSTFVNSRQWIGAIELSYVLDTLIGVSSKLLTFSSGAEVPSRAREIARHFETQGTPIMIGGGVLAFTLLGVDFNPLTGEVAFLILDPHYTGSENIKSIVSGGWCAWKKGFTEPNGAPGDVFVKDAFYNLLLPQRPNTV